MYLKSWWYDLLFFRYTWSNDLVLFLECDRLKLVIIGHFLLFYPSPLSPPKNLKNQNFEKMNKSGDIILHICTTNDDHMMYGSWDTDRNRQNFLSFIFLDHFCPNTPLTTRKIKILKQWKKRLEILSFYTCAP